MNGRPWIFATLIVVTILIPACAGKPAKMSAERRAPGQSPGFKHLLGRSVEDEEVVEYVANNHCTRSGKFVLCPVTGLAFWTNESEMVATIYLYPNITGSYLPYRGVLPFGLRFYDNLGAVEQKLRKLETHDELDAIWNAGQPDEGGSPDHLYYWATYERYGMTIIYNAPFPDEDTTIRSILINQFFLIACRRPLLAEYCGT